MKSVGLIGGLTWHSSVEYYRRINEMVNDSIGGRSSAKIILYSYDFEEIHKLQENKCWKELDESFSQVARVLVSAGADYLAICSNTSHLFASSIAKATGKEVLHIADASGEALRDKNCGKCLVLGTPLTMELPFYRSILEGKYNVQMVTPSAEERAKIGQIIFDELAKGLVEDESQVFLDGLIRMFIEVEDIEAILLACTELQLIVGDITYEIPVLDTLELHCRYISRRLTPEVF